MRPSPYRTPTDPRPKPLPLYGAEPRPAFVVAVLLIVASILYVFRDHSRVDEPRVDAQGYVVVMHVTPAHAGHHR